MPASVLIPARFTVDVAALNSGLADVEEAFTAALGRALRSSVEMVMNPRGEYVHAALNPPQVAWSGAGLSRITGETRRAFHEMIERVIRTVSLQAQVSAASPSKLRAGIAETPASEPIDWSRWSDEDSTYLLPFYDRPKNQKVSAKKKGDKDEDKPTLGLYHFESHQEAVEMIASSFKEYMPKGSTYFGVYGILNEMPTLVWIAGTYPEGKWKGHLIIEEMVLLSGKTENGEWKPSANTPMAIELNAKHTLKGLTTPKKKDNVPYAAVRTRMGYGQEIPVFTTDPRVKGKTIHFAAPGAEVLPEIIGQAPPPPPPPTPAQPVSPVPPDWAYWGNLPAIPQDGVEAWLWWWFVWFNVKPKSIRDNAQIRSVFADWERWGWREDAINLNWLFLHIYRGKIYKHFCRYLALHLLSKSRDNMTEFLAELKNPALAQRLESEIAVIREPARELVAIRAMASNEQYAQAREEQKNNIVDQVEKEKYDREWIEPLRSQIRFAKSVLHKEPNIVSLLDLFKTMDPLLMILTVDDNDTLPLEKAITKFADFNGERLVQLMQVKLEWMFRKSWEATKEITGDFEIAQKLKIVQQVAAEHLKDWFAVDRGMKDTVDRINDKSILGWLAMGIGALILTFVFPPLGLVVGAGIGITSAVISTRDAMQLARLGRARLAQYGFAALASREEIDMAMFQAAVDIFFAVLDVAALAKAGASLAGKVLGRAAAREATGALARSIERFLEPWRVFSDWPLPLRTQIRGNVIHQLEKQGVQDAAASADKILAAVQSEMLRRYELEMLRFQKSFEEAVTSGSLNARDVDAMAKWLQNDFKAPNKFLTDMTGDLAPGKSLFDDTVGKHIAGQVVPVRVFKKFFGDLTEDELKIYLKSLGEYAEHLRPNRVAALAKEAGLDLTYREASSLAKRMLEKVDDPARAMGDLEKILPRVKDPQAAFQHLANSVNPRKALDAMLQPKVLDTPLAGGVDELFQAVGAPVANGKVGRIVSDVDQAGAQRLYREVLKDDGKRVAEVWDSASRSWTEASQGRFARQAVEQPLAEVTVEAETRALQELLDLATERTAGGALRAPAKRAKEVLDLIDTDLKRELAKVGARGNKETVRSMVDSLGYLLEGGVRGRELEGVANYLRRGGDPELMANMLRRGATETGKSHRYYIRSGLEKLVDFGESEFKGMTIAFKARGGGLNGAEAVLDIARWYDNPSSVFKALNNMAPHADGLDKVVRYLKSWANGNNRAAVAQLKAAEDLLKEYPGNRIVFEAAIEDAEGILLREIDVRIVTPYSRVTVLDVEIKEISTVFFVEGARPRRQFRKDIVFSVKASKAGERPLGKMRWQIREEEILASVMKKHKLTDIAAGRKQALADLKAVFDKAFERQYLSELTDAQFAAALKDFNDNFGDIVKLF